jgi:hypothetical protein
MCDEQRIFLSLLSGTGRLPARLNAAQTAWLLNVNASDIPTLIRKRLLKPLGNPARNAAKYFATVEVLNLANDRTWLVKATDGIHEYWHNKRARRNQGGADHE